MPEGDTIHRIAARINAALGEREIEAAEAPNPRSPVHTRAGELHGRTLERAEAFGKHLVAHFSGDVALHSHLGMNGRWRISGDGARPAGTPWLLLASGRGIAAQSGGRVLRIVSESRIRNDPGLRRLGPDPLRPGFEIEAAAARLGMLAAGREVGEALLDQEVIAGIGNAIRNEGLFRARVSPWRKVGELDGEELERIVAENQWVMRTALASGRRPHAVYRAHRRGCQRCGGPVRSRGQGDDNRTAYWCPRCQPD